MERVRNLTLLAAGIDFSTRDGLVPPCQSEPFTELVGSSDRKTLRLSAGHIGLAVGSKAQKELWPQVVQWPAERWQ